MSEQDNQQFAERLLDEALTAYGECEPPAGLEERILGQVRATKSTRLVFWPVLAVAATMLLGIVVLRDWRTVETPKTVQTSIERPLPKQQAANPPTEQSVEKVSNPRTAAERRLIARRPMTPAPRTPTDESPIPPVPVSELVLAEMASAEIEIEVLTPEPENLATSLSLTADAPLTLEPLAEGSEEGRKK